MRYVILILIFILLAVWLYLGIVPARQTSQAPVAQEGKASHVATASNSSIQEEKTQEGKVSISVVPQTVIQGEPVMFVLEGVESTDEVKKFTLENSALKPFMHKGKVSALYAIDLRAPVKSYKLELELEDGSKREFLAVGKRVVESAPFGIPDKLGGNTPQAEQELVNTLVQEAAIINAIKTSGEKLWDGEFVPPLKGELSVTDEYGYSRQTGGSTLSHKGTDFRASIGTPVYAMNSGKVAFVRFLRNYGNTVAIDHGLGLLTIYMHLSETSVKEGEMVKKGDRIGKSGDTGYVLGPHLHVSIRIDNISIDPMKFMEILGEK